MSVRSISTGYTGLSRRDFLKLMGVALASTELSGCGPLVNAEGDRLTSDKISAFIKDQFGIRSLYVGEGVDASVLNSKNETVEFDEIDRGWGNATHIVERLYSNLCKYPREFHRSINRFGYSVLLGKNLRTEYKDKSITDLNGKLIFTATGPIVCLNTESEYPQTYDHEIFHYIAVSQGYWNTIDSSFRKINERHNLPPYSEDPNQLKMAVCELHILQREGSSSCYGTTDPNEDAAEIARALMNGDSDLKAQIPKDKALKQKANEVIQIFKSISGGRMNEEFFATLTEGHSMNFWGWPDIPQSLYS